MSAMDNIVGIDIGNDKCVVAIVKPKAIQILMNHDGKYEIPSVVSFTKKKRQIGSDKSSLATMNPHSTIIQIKRLIGQNFEEPGMAEELKLLPFKTSKAEDGGIVIHLNYLGKECAFTPVQILAMLLCHLKQMIERNDVDMPVSDCVISVPSYFNDLQRVAYLNAAAIAGLNPLRLMNDGTAIALGYGYFKRELDSSINVVFVDVGHSDTQVTVAQFNREGVRILAHAFDRNLGGRNFDRVLYNHFLKDFNDRYEIDIESTPRASIRLMSACEKVKTVLTANREANISIDCLVNDIGVDGSIKRDDFDAMSTQLVRRFLTTLKVALEDSKLENDGIHSVELVGSGSRIPFISKVARSLFSREPSRTLNESDCVARGCALQCSMLSGSRGFREYKVQDSVPFSFGFSWRLRSAGTLEDETNQNVKNSTTGSLEGGNIPVDGDATKQISSILFKKGQHFPSTDNIEISAETSQEFQFSSFYEYRGIFIPHASQKSRTFKVDNIKTGLSKSNPVRIEISVDLHGMIGIKSASQQNSCKGKQEITWENLICEEILPIGMSNDSLAEAQESERGLLQHDEKVDEGQRQKNDLEAFLYSTRKEFQLDGRFEEYTKKSEEERILKKLDALEPWLSENDDHEEESMIYAEELRTLLKELVNPVESRYIYFMDCIEATEVLDISIAELDRVWKSKKVGYYYNHYSGWIGALKKLQKLFPKYVEQLPVLLEKIKLMTTLTTEERCCLTESCKMEDSYQTMQRYASLFRDANKCSLFECHEGEQKKKNMWSLFHEICTKLSDLLQTSVPNSPGPDEFPKETMERLLQKDKNNHVDKLGTSSLVPLRMQNLKQEELKHEHDASSSSSELKREQQERKPERTAEEKDLIKSTIADIQLQLSERYGDFIPQLEKVEIDKKLHEIKNCLLHSGDDEIFDQKNHELRKLLACVEENYMKEESTGQQRAQLLYMIFDSRVKIICIASYKSYMARYQQFNSLVELAKNVCDNVEKKLEEVKSQDTQPCEMEYKKSLKRLQLEIQRFEDTVIEAKTEEATLDLEERLLDIEKKVFGRYRYVVEPDEKKYILNVIEKIRDLLQRNETGHVSRIWLREKEEMKKVMSTLEGRYQKHKSLRVEAAEELCDCIFEHLRTAQSKTISSSNASLIKQQCNDDQKWLDKIYERRNITTGEIKKRLESLDTYWECLMRNDFQTKLQRNDDGTVTRPSTSIFSWRSLIPDSHGQQ